MKSEDRNPKTGRNSNSENRNSGVTCSRSDLFRVSVLGFRVWALVILALLVFGLTLPPAAAASIDTVPQWGIYEVVLNGPTNGNPFLDVRLSAVFNNGSRSIEVPGFYDGDGVYRIRFMPDQQGVWHYETRANRWPLTKRLGSFTVTAPTPGNHGPVRVHNTYHFAYADGTPYYPVGTRSITGCRRLTTGRS